MIHTIWASL